MANLNVIWSKFAADQLDILHQYLILESNKNIAYKQTRELLKTTKKLAEFPQSGKIEPLLINEYIEYRYLIKQHFKIIYYINFELNEVRIVDLFDTRQNPKKMVRAIK